MKKNLKLLNFPLQDYAMVWLKIWEDRNLVEGVLQVDGENHVLLPEGPQTGETISILQSNEGTIAVKILAIYYQLPPY